MIHQRRRDLSTGSHFSFTDTRDPNGGGARHGLRTSQFGVDHGPWIDRTKGSSYSYYSGSDRRKLDPWTWRASLSRYDHGKNINADDEEDEGEEDLAWPVRVDENRSGTPSPPLWKNNAGGRGSPVASRSAGASPLHHSHAGGQIARFRQEMLELVRDMPESGYELSLRDMVQPPKPPRVPAAETGKEKKEEEKKTKTVKNKKVKQMAKSESMANGGGLLLKVFTPAASMGAGRRRSSGGGGSNSFARVSPKPAAGREMDGEWWRKNELSGSSGGSSNSSSNSKSSSDNSKSRGRKKGGCYSFLLRTQHGAEEI